jgi:flagellar biosynthesis protein FlhA
MASVTKIPDDLSEQARKRLGMYFIKELESEPNKLIALTFEPRLEQSLLQRVKRSQFDVGMVMDPEVTQGILSELEPKVEEMTSTGLTPVIVTTSELRLAFRRFMEPSYPQLVVLAYQEIPSETYIEPFGAISIPQFSLPHDVTSTLIDEEQSVPDSESRATELAV